MLDETKKVFKGSEYSWNELVSTLSELKIIENREQLHSSDLFQVSRIILNCIRVKKIIGYGMRWSGLIYFKPLYKSIFIAAKS